MRNHLSQKRIFEIALSFVVALLIYWSFFYVYKNCISPAYLTENFNFRELTYQTHALAIVFFLLPLLWLPIQPERPSDIALWLLYMFSYAPTAFVCFHILQEPFPNAIYLLMAMLIALIITDLTRRHPVKLSFHLNSPVALPLDKIIFLFSILVCIYILYLAKFTFSLNFENIYIRRLAFTESSTLLSGYILAFGRSVVVIFFIYMAFVKKSKTALIALVILSLGIFSYDGTKNSLFVPVFLCLICFLTIYKKSNIALNIILLCVILISIIEYAGLDSQITSALFTRRIFAVPGFLNSAFWEYYSGHEKVLMTDSIGKFFVTLSNVTPSTYIIGYEYLNDPDANANTGIWMGGYAHFGFVGIILMSMIAGFILGLVDNLTKTKFPLLGFLACAYIGILWSEQMLHTSMLTGGVFYILIFLLIYCNTSVINRTTSYFHNVLLALKNPIMKPDRK